MTCNLCGSPIRDGAVVHAPECPVLHSSARTLGDRGLRCRCGHIDVDHALFEPHTDPRREMCQVIGCPCRRFNTGLAMRHRPSVVDFVESVGQLGPSAKTFARDVLGVFDEASEFNDAMRKTVEEVVGKPRSIMVSNPTRYAADPPFEFKTTPIRSHEGSIADEMKVLFNKHMGVDPIEPTREQLIAENQKLRARVAHLERALLERICEDTILTTTLDDEEEETDGRLERDSVD